MNLPDSIHYDWQPLADGVLAAIMKAEGSQAASNAGIIDLGDQTIVFDTSVTPAAGRDLLAAAQAFTGRQPSFVINSHYHGDHIRGNQVFGPNTHIISTTITAELITQRGLAQVAYQKENLPQLFAEHEAKLAATTDEQERANIQGLLDFYRPTLLALPELELRLPNITFAQKMTIQGSPRTAELMTYGGGHSPSDAFLYLPDCDIIFMADLLFVGTHPFLSDGDPDEFLQILDRVKQLEADHFVPGHGSVGTPHDVTFMQHYIHTLRAAAAQIAAEGGTADHAANHPIPPEFSHLTNVAGMYQDTLRFFFEKVAVQ